MKIKKLSVCFLAVLGLCCISAFGLLKIASTANAEIATLSSDVAFEETYSINSDVTVPAANIVYGGTQRETSVKIVFPNEKTYLIEAGGKVNVSEFGEYTVVYYAMADGKYVSVSKTFMVKNQLVTFSGDKSTCTYGAHSVYAKRVRGLVVSLAQGETMRFNRIIDLKALNGEKAFTFFATPELSPLADADVIKFTFTDAYDENNYVTVRVKFIGDGTESWNNNNVYCDATFGSQAAYTGLESKEKSTDTVYIEGGNYYLHKNSKEYGSPIYFSTAGYIDSDDKLGDYKYGVSFDLDKKTVYSQTEEDTKLITDLDSAVLYTDLWKGFTTGEVFLSVSAENYSVGALGMVFTDIGGYDLKESDFLVESAPIVSVDTDGYDEKALPHAIVGKRYNVFGAQAYDVYDGKTDVTVKTYFGYHSTKTTDVWTNGEYFVPQFEGIYTIEYLATNSNGKTTVKTLDVKAVKSTDANALSINVDGKENGGGVGCKIKVAEAYTVQNTTGRYSVNATAVLDSDNSVKYEIDENLTFTPLYAGTYTITFDCADYVMQTLESYKLTVTVEDGKPLISDEAVLLPKTLIKGMKYEIPQISGYTFTSGTPQSAVCEIFVKEDDGAEKKLTENIYTVAANGSVKLIYRLTEGEKKTDRSLEFDVIDVREGNDLSVGKYFRSTSATATSVAESGYVVLSTNENTVWEFINPLPSAETTWRIRTADASDAVKKFEKIEFTLSDLLNSDLKVVVSVYKNGDNIAVAVNGEIKTEIEAKFSDYNGKDLIFTFNEKNKTLAVDAVTGIKINTYSNGETFNGFTSGKITLNIGLSGVTGESSVFVRQINNQTLRDMKKETTGPDIFCETLRGYRTKGDVITFSAPSTGDVLDSYATLKFTVKKSDGTFVTAEDGTILNGSQDPYKEYKYKVTDYGSIEVSYESQDSLGNTENYSYVIHCKDKTAPVLSLSDAVTEGKVGKKIKIATLSASDDSGNDGITTFIALYDCDGVVKELTGDNFVADKAGVYKIVYMAFDAEGNVATIFYNVTVS